MTMYGSIIELTNEETDEDVFFMGEVFDYHF